MREPEQRRNNSENDDLESRGPFHSLPDDLAIRCLVRVPRRYHSALAAVCREWREMLHSSIFFSLRKEMGLSEGWVYALMRDNSEVLHWHVMDPAKRIWKPMPPLRDETNKLYGMACEVIDRELFFVGGGMRFKPPVAEVLKYDPVSNAWKESAPLDTARHYFASAVFDGKLYAVGGMGSTFDSLHSYEVYDPKAESWSTFSDANIVSDLGEALILNGMLYTRHVCPNLLPRSYASVYDPAKCTWEFVDSDFTRSWCGPTAVTDAGDVYMLDQTFGLKIMTLKHGTVEWKPVGRLSPRSIQPPCKMAIVNNDLYIVGRGLRTIVYNLDRGDDGRGMLVTSSIRPLDSSENVVVSCNVIEI
ncbi:hypothetical protein R1flu_024406 [Riccia fluitans]|uniref:F-box domain-containing protein n=1 Tax=Riccia fluitans TaxID=41844 RepID=A0ABD1XUU9_9MARC